MFPKTTLLLISLIISLACFGQLDTSKKTFLTGKIIGAVSLTPHCGIFAFATVIELEIEQYEDPSYTEKAIPVIVSCPELYGESFFQVGSTYLMEIAITTPVSFQWRIFNESILGNYPLKEWIWVVNAKKMDN